MHDMRFGLIGAGFWASFHLAGWAEVPGAKCAAVYNRTRAKAEHLAEQFQIDRVYDDPREMLAAEQLDFVDCITDVNTHPQFIQLAAEHRLPVICQKPLAPTLQAARDMAAACQRAGIPLLVHENWRWQTPLRELKRVLNEKSIGRLFRAYPICQQFSGVRQPALPEGSGTVRADRHGHAHPGHGSVPVR